MPVVTAAVLLHCACYHSMQPLIGGSCAELHLLHRVCLAFRMLEEPIVTSAICNAISPLPSTASSSSAGIDSPFWTQAPPFLDVWQACKQHRVQLCSLRFVAELQRPLHSARGAQKGSPVPAGRECA